MATILILLVLQLGTINGVYIGEFDSPAMCERAAAQATESLRGSPALAEVDAAALICVPKQEA